MNGHKTVFTRMFDREKFTKLETTQASNWPLVKQIMVH